jgi:hypothetical protein
VYFFSSSAASSSPPFIGRMSAMPGACRVISSSVSCESIRFTGSFLPSY